MFYKQNALSLAFRQRVDVYKSYFFYWFDDAYEVTDFFINHIEELSDDSIKKLMEIYNNNNQFKNRYRHSNDMEIIKKHLENEHKEVEKNSTNDDNWLNNNISVQAESTLVYTLISFYLLFSFIK